MTNYIFHVANKADNASIVEFNILNLIRIETILVSRSNFLNNSIESTSIGRNICI